MILEQPEENHNGGQLAFGPTARSTSGWATAAAHSTARDHAQDLDSLLGKLVSRRPRRAGPPRAWRGRAPTAFAIRGGSGSMPRSARSGSATSARTRSRRSTARCSSSTSRPRTSAGRRSRAPVGTARPIATSRGRASSSGQSPFLRARRRRALLRHRRRGSTADRAAPALGGRFVYGDFCSGDDLVAAAPNPERERARRAPRAREGPANHALSETDADGELLLASATGDVHRVRTPTSTGSPGWASGSCPVCSQIDTRSPSAFGATRALDARESRRSNAGR